MKTYKIAAAFMMTLLLSTGCEKDFLDVNVDPNNPANVPTSLLITSGQVNVTEVFANSLIGGYTGTVMKHWNQRGNINDYGLDGRDFSLTVAWTSLYAGALTDLNVAIEQATEAGDTGSAGVAQVVKALAVSNMVDLWGDIPYFDANKGTTTLAPVYDGGAAIYADLHTVLDAALANLAAETRTAIPGDVFGLSPQGWIQVANSLKLRMYNKVRLVQNVSTEVNALIAANNFVNAAAGSDLDLAYGTLIAPENRNPGFVQEWTAGGSNFQIDPFFYETMRGLDTFGHGGVTLTGAVDPRIPYYFFNQLPAGSGDADAENPCAYCPSRTGTSFLSIFSHSFNIDPNEGFDQSSSRTLSGLYPLGGRYDDGLGGIGSNAAALAPGQVTGTPTMPQRLLNEYEILYVRAELAQEGVSTEDPRALFSLAMDASFAKVDELAAIAGAPALVAADAIAYRDVILGLYDAATAAGQLELIMTQKWIASFGNGLVSYNDYRRTGFPRLHDGNTDALAVTVQTRQFPVSLPYHTTNLTLNPNAPSQKIIATAKVFWDN